MAPSASVNSAPDPPPESKSLVTDDSSETKDPGPEYVSISIGSNVLQIELNDTIEFFSNASNSLLVEGDYWQQQGPLSYVGLTKSDPFIKIVRSFSIEIFRTEEFANFVHRKKKKPNRPLDSKTSPGSGSSVSGPPDESMSGQDPPDSKEDDTDLISADALVTTRIGESDPEKLPFSDSPVASMGFPNFQVLQSLMLLRTAYFAFVEDQVVRLLPSRDSLYFAVNRFFKHVAPFIPVLNETTFCSDVRPLLGGKFPENSDSAYHRVFIRDEHDLNLAGQLLLVLRLGYMTVIPTADSDCDLSAGEKLLVRSVTRFKSDHYVSVINLCVADEKIHRKSSFRIVQSLALLFYYRLVAPNDCLGLSALDSQLLFGAIVNHALSIGLNRDPMAYADIHYISKKDDFVNTWRTIWHWIAATDAMGAMLCGTPPKIPSLDISSVQNPNFDHLSPQNASAARHLHEKTHESCESYRFVLGKLTNMKNKAKVIDVLKETSRLEGVFLELFGQDFFKDYVCTPAPAHSDSSDNSDKLRRDDALLKVNRFLTFIHLRASLSCLYYMVVIHYEEKLDADPNAHISAGIELFKIFIRSVVQLVYIMSYALDNSHELFGRYYDFILTSGIERCLIKTHNFITSFFIRLVNYKRTLVMMLLSHGDDLDIAARSEVVDTLFAIAMSDAELFVGNFHTLSKTYINSYKIYVMAYFVLKQCMENPEKLFEGVVNHKRYFHDGNNLLQFFSIPELHSLCKLCEEFRIAKVESERRQKRRPRAHTKDSPDVSDDVDVSMANRAMYANRNTVNTYGTLKEKHMYLDFGKHAFDEQSMIGNEELLRLFELYGD